MESTDRNILIGLLQEHLGGKIKPEANFNPQFLADAILTKLNLNQSTDGFETKRLRGLITEASAKIDNLNADMQAELDALKPEEKLFANFIKGKQTSYLEVADILKGI